MAEFRLYGKAIKQDSADCPVEVIENDASVQCNNFFKVSNNSGKVIIDGVTNANYQLVSYDSNTGFNDCKADAFNSKIKVNGVPSSYCLKGKAPRGINLVDYGTGTYYFYWKPNGECYFQDSSGGTLVTLSTTKEKRRFFTFMLCGGGGSGCSGGSGMGWWGGGGGSGAGFAQFTLECTDQAVNENQSIKFKIEVGGGGDGRGASGKGGYGGGDTKVTPDSVYPSSFGSDDVAVANGGKGNPKKSKVDGGGASVSDSRGSNAYFKILNSYTNGGGYGGAEASKGGDTGSASGYNYSVNNNYVGSVGGYTGGGKSGGGNGGGGGGASSFADGNAEKLGCGGHGGEGAFGSGKSSQKGGAGFIRIYY